MQDVDDGIEDHEAGANPVHLGEVFVDVGVRQAAAQSFLGGVRRRGIPRGVQLGSHVLGRDRGE